MEIMTYELHPCFLNLEVIEIDDHGVEDVIGKSEIELETVTDNENPTKWSNLQGHSGSVMFYSKFIPVEDFGTILDDSSSPLLERNIQNVSNAVTAPKTSTLNSQIEELFDNSNIAVAFEVENESFIDSDSRKPSELIQKFEQLNQNDDLVHTARWNICKFFMPGIFSYLPF